MISKLLNRNEYKVHQVCYEQFVVVDLLSPHVKTISNDHPPPAGGKERDEEIMVVICNPNAGFELAAI